MIYLNLIKKIPIIVFLICSTYSVKVNSQTDTTVEDAMIFLKGYLGETFTGLARLSYDSKLDREEMQKYEKEYHFSSSYSIESYSECSMKLNIRLIEVFDSIAFSYSGEYFERPSKTTVIEWVGNCIINFSDISEMEEDFLYHEPIKMMIPKIIMKTYSKMNLIKYSGQVKTKVYKKFYTNFQNGDDDWAQNIYWEEDFHTKLLLKKPDSIKENRDEGETNVLELYLNSSDDNLLKRLKVAFKFLVDNCGALKDKF